MSVTFAAVFVIETDSLHSALLGIGDSLLTLGLGPVGAVSGFSYNPDDEEYEDHPAHGVAALSVFSPQSAPNEAAGFNVAFQSAHVHLVVRLAVQPDGSRVCFIDLTDRNLYELFRNQRAADLRAILAACAHGCDAQAGLGAMELDWAPYTRKGVLEAITSGPSNYEGNPPPFGVLHAGLYTQEAANKLGRGAFDVHRVRNYWVLERTGLAAEYAQLAR